MAGIANLRIENFKAFRDFQVRLNAMNIFAGANNAGKSTILDAFRALSGAVRFARRRLPTISGNIKGRQLQGYTIPNSSIPITTVNVHHLYREEDARLHFQFPNGNGLCMEFDREGTCHLFVDTQGTRISSIADFEQEFPLDIAIVPTLGPFEEQEGLLAPETVRSQEKTRRSHRLFRNIWHYRNNQQFQELSNFVTETWPGMQIHKPRVEGFGKAVDLSMMCREGEFVSEVYWVGFGFQVWLQFLTHLIGAENSDVIVIDEPDIYLHPDLQRKLFTILRASGKQIVLATHSPEILSKAEFDDVVFVDKKRTHGKRINDIEGLQSALEAIGSVYDVHLNRLAHGKKVVFFEGQDFKIYRRFAAKLGLTEIVAELNFTTMPIGGFSEHRKIQDAVWTFEKILKTEIDVFAVFDRDYMTPETVAEFIGRMKDAVPHCYVLERKEIENYLLDERAIAEAVAERLGRSKIKLGTKHVEVALYAQKALRRALAATKQEAHSDYLAARLPSIRGKLSDKTIIAATIKDFEDKWATLEGRIALAPGKKVFARLNQILQKEAKISITYPLIIEKIRKKDVPEDLQSILKKLGAHVS